MWQYFLMGLGCGVAFGVVLLAFGFVTITRQGPSAGPSGNGGGPAPNAGTPPQEAMSNAGSVAVQLGCDPGSGKPHWSTNCAGPHNVVRLQALSSSGTCYTAISDQGLSVPLIAYSVSQGCTGTWPSASEVQPGNAAQAVGGGWFTGF